MKGYSNNSPEQGPDSFIRICHLGLILFGITAWLTGDAADDYKEFRHLWFTLHGWIGMGLASSLFMYILYGMLGPRESRFFQGVPYTKKGLQMVREDIAGLLRFRLPDRAGHQGLAGLVQFFGVLLFAGMAVTGALMFFLLEPGSKAGGLVHAIKEVHEAGEILIPLYLSIHVGAVLLHSITGHPVWKRILFLEKSEVRSQ